MAAPSRLEDGFTQCLHEVLEHLGIQLGQVHERSMAVCLAEKQELECEVVRLRDQLRSACLFIGDRERERAAGLDPEVGDEPSLDSESQGLAPQQPPPSRSGPLISMRTANSPGAARLPPGLHLASCTASGTSCSSAARVSPKNRPSTPGSGTSGVAPEGPKNRTLFATGSSLAPEASVVSKNRSTFVSGSSQANGSITIPEIQGLVRMGSHQRLLYRSPMNSREANLGCADGATRQVSPWATASDVSATPSAKSEGAEPLGRTQTNRMMMAASMQAFRRNESTEMIYQRLRARLGHLNSKSMINGQDLHQSVSALGLERYTLKEMNYLVYRLGLMIDLNFKKEEDRAGKSSPLGKQLAIAPTWSLSDQKGRRDVEQLAQAAEWKWPDFTDTPSGTKRMTTLGSATFGSVLSNNFGSELDHSDKLLPLKALLKTFLEEEGNLRKYLGIHLTDQILAIKDVLLSGDANRLVAELTHVRIDDLATNRQQVEHTDYLEPLVGLMIILNGFQVGMQTDPGLSQWNGWQWVEMAFTAFFVLEIAVRVKLHGPREYFLGSDFLWNWFDFGIVGVGLADTLLTAVHSTNMTSPVLLRFVRLARLSRLVRVFRLKFMRELQLMVKGILSGIQTLIWAFVLLFFVMYVLAVATTSIFSDAEDEQIRDNFVNVPRSMFTTFRCLTGDCFTLQGASLTAVLFHHYGISFAVAFVASYMTVSLGIFNVILALYVETTMTAAKQTDDANKGRHERESIRVAQITKRLLKMFCAAEREFNAVSATDRSSLDLHSIMVGPSAGIEEVEVNDKVEISKELFLLVIQDPDIQKLMDDLDIPPDRANLFDSLDADGSGALHAAELVRGLLKVRGELKKSDQVACVLAIRAIQASLREWELCSRETQTLLMRHMGLLPVSMDEEGRGPDDSSGGQTSEGSSMVPPLPGPQGAYHVGAAWNGHGYR